MADRVVLEITERAAIEEVRDAPGCVRRLRDMGFRIAVDDLGAGPQISTLRCSAIHAPVAS